MEVSKTGTYLDTVTANPRADILRCALGGEAYRPSPPYSSGTPRSSSPATKRTPYSPSMGSAITL